LIFELCTLFFVLQSFVLKKKIYREAVATQSPGVLQPWETDTRDINPERVAPKTVLVDQWRCRSEV
jgi:hypothetical protein